MRSSTECFKCFEHSSLEGEDVLRENKVGFLDHVELVGCNVGIHSHTSLRLEERQTNLVGLSITGSHLNYVQLIMVVSR